MSDPYEWDGVYVHFCLVAGQSAQDATQACGILLSTWEGANSKGQNREPKYPDRRPTEDRVGYTFERCHKVTCPNCIAWMEANLPKCDGCGNICAYGTCGSCLDWCICGKTVIYEDTTINKWSKWEQHAEDCPGRKIMDKDDPRRQAFKH